MSGLTHTKYTPLVDKMKSESGDRNFPIWLLFNPKHPVVSHYIWTPVLAEIQDIVYRELHIRINAPAIYHRNVVSDSAIVPRTANWWGPQVGAEIENFKELVKVYNPKILISFGAFPFEFVRRVFEIQPEKGPKSWGNSNLDEEFRKSIEEFDAENSNRIPLFRRMASSRKFNQEENQAYYENYIHYVGEKLAEIIIKNRDKLNIWV